VKPLTMIGMSAAVLLSSLLATPAYSQEATDPEATEQKAARVEITPFVAIGSVRSSQVGAAIAFPVAPSLSLETEVGYRGTGGLNLLSMSANLLYWVPKVGRIAPYLAAGAGLEHYPSPHLGPGGEIVPLVRTAFAVNAGGGVKVPVDDSWGMRVDARWYKAVGRQASSEHWRIANGISFGAGKR
jgi:hypothetical protein